MRKGTEGFILDSQPFLPSTGRNKHKLFYGYIVVIAGFLVMTIMFGAQYSFGVFFKPVLTEFGWTRAMTSGAYSLYIILHGLSCIITGRLTDRYGPRLVVTICGLFLGTGYLLMSQINAIWQLYLFYGVFSSLGMSSYVPLLSVVTRWFVRRRGLMTGIVVSGVGAGTIVMPPLATQLIASYGWRTSYIVVGCIALVGIALASQFLRREPAQMGQVPYGADEVKSDFPDLDAQGLSVREAVHTIQFWLLGAVFFSFLFTEHMLLVHIVPHATDIGISAANAASILSIIGGLSIVGRISVGSASDRIGNKPSLVIVFGLMAIALFWLLVARELWMLNLFAIVFGFSYGASVLLQSTTVAGLFGTRSHGAILGMVVFVAAIGGAIGPLIAGRIFYIENSYYLAFLACAVLSVIGFVLALFLKPLSYLRSPLPK